MPCGPIEVNRRFGENIPPPYPARCRRQAQFCLLSASCLAHPSNLKMVTIWSLETSADFHGAIRPYIEDVSDAKYVQMYLSFNLEEIVSHAMCKPILSYRILLNLGNAQLCLRAVGLSPSVCMSLMKLRELSSVSKLMQNQFLSEGRRDAPNKMMKRSQVNAEKRNGSTSIHKLTL
jgi:hypothetical protein